MPIGAASVIKSVQRGTKSVAGVSDTVTISSVDTSKSILLINNDTSDLDDARKSYVRGILTDATTITFTKFMAGNPTVVAWQVIEWF